MNIRTVMVNETAIALIESEDILISDVQSALDCMATARYETGADCMALNKEALDGRFFVLSTRLAGEILQKFVNYQMKLAIVGDFSGYTSKPLQDFIRESNAGNHVFFVSTEEEAIKRLAHAT